jgi:hypothetical protein
MENKRPEYSAIRKENIQQMRSTRTIKLIPPLMEGDQL